MPLYEYRCGECEGRFELRRPVAEASLPATCPAGHEGARRLLSVFSTTGRAGGGDLAPVGGCGAGCACAAAAAH